MIKFYIYFNIEVVFLIVFWSNILQHIMFFALRIEKTSFPKPLSREEEAKCFEQIKNNNKLARDRLIKHNLRLVAHIVKKYYIANDDQDDLISIGIIGLIKAVKSFKYEKKIKFETYASRCIENEILMHFRQLKKNVTSLYIDDIFESSSKLGCFLRATNTEEENDILDIVDRRCKANYLYSLINLFLTKREKKVLIYRYGLYGKIPLTQQETAKKLKISRSYVSRIEKKAIEKLTKKFKKTY